MTLPSISVVVPTYRRPKQLKSAIESVVGQTGIDPSTYEIVIIDNCPEASADWIKGAFLGHLPVLRYVHEPQKGYAMVRNRGVREARGAFIAFLDDDETAQPDWLQELTDLLINTDADAVFGPVRPIYPRDFEGDRYYLDAVFAREFRLPRGADLRASHMRLGTGNSAFRVKTCFDRPEPFAINRNEAGGEDCFFLRELVGRGRKLVWAPRAIVSEHVPAGRCDVKALARRRFLQGKLRTLTCWANNRRDIGGVAFWMCAGLAQGVWLSAVSVLVDVIYGRQLARFYRVRAAGGWGKVFWWTKDRTPQDAGPADGSETVAKRA